MLPNRGLRYCHCDLNPKTFLLYYSPLPDRIREISFRQWRDKMFSDQLRHFFFKCSIRPISIYIFKQITKRFIVCCVPTRVACLGCIYGRSEQVSGFWSRHFKEACFRLIFTIKHHVVWMVRVKRSRFMFSPCSDGKYIKILLFPYVIKREHLSRKNMSTLALNYDAYGRKTKRSIKTYKICRVLFIFFLCFTEIYTSLWFYKYRYAYVVPQERWFSTLKLIKTYLTTTKRYRY